MLAWTSEPVVILLGVAHVVDLESPLRAALGGRDLDGVALELDPERAEAVLAPEGVARRQAKGPLFARLWAHLQQRLGASLGGGLPGREMRAAWSVAREKNLPVFLIDDPIGHTLVRLVRSMPPRERVSLLLGSVVGLFLPSRFVAGEIDRYTDDPAAFVGELRAASPTVARVLLDERNAHMASRLEALVRQGRRRLAAVVGDAHVPGLGAELERRGVRVTAVPFGTLRTLRGPSSTPS